jgi:ubiquitin-protein ligase
VNAVRERRLHSDYAAAQAAVMTSRMRIVIEEAFGQPPEAYHFLFHCTSVAAVDSDRPVYRQEHRVSVKFPALYPAQAPIATILTPIVHPHIWPNGTVCLGSWRPVEKLDSLLQRIGSILTYNLAALNWRSVANDAAAMWAKQNQDLFPLDQPFFSAIPVRMLHTDNPGESIKDALDGLDRYYDSFPSTRTTG